MLQSHLFAKTKKEAPREAQTISHQYLSRGDFIDQTGAGIYSFLPLGWRVYQKIENIIRQEMNALGGQELSMPILIPKGLWQETGRWENFNPPLFKVKDRRNKEYGLGSTHEEVITDLVRKRIKSYQDLPVYLYQIQSKFRNELRATSGLLRVREFMMKDLYSFHHDEKDALAFYRKAQTAYFKIFERCGLKTISVEAESGSIGGQLNHEFMFLSEVGEDRIVLCPKCGYGANLEKAGDIGQCPGCGAVLEKRSAIEVGHIFYLGEKYSRAMKAEFIDQKGKKKTAIMGCYGIGLGRLMATIAEAHHDEKGLIWPSAVAPFDIHLIALNDKAGKIKEQAEEIYQSLEKDSFDVLYDDRDKSVGEKFAEADLIGIPLRVVVSEKTLVKDSVEVKGRQEKKGKLVEISNLISVITK